MGTALGGRVRTRLDERVRDGARENSVEKGGRPICIGVEGNIDLARKRDEAKGGGGEAGSHEKEEPLGSPGT